MTTPSTETQRGALAPKHCTRCQASMLADSEGRPLHIDSRLYAPANPRPMLGDTEVWWEVEADYEKRGPISAMLCPACASELSDWLHRA